AGRPRPSRAAHRPSAGDAPGRPDRTPRRGGISARPPGHADLYRRSDPGRRRRVRQPVPDREAGRRRIHRAGRTGVARAGVGGGLRVAATAGADTAITNRSGAAAGADRYSDARGAVASGNEAWTRAVLTLSGPCEATDLPAPRDPALARALDGAEGLLIA